MRSFLQVLLSRRTASEEWPDVAGAAAAGDGADACALAVAGSDDGLWDWDLVGGHIDFSPRWKAMLGYGEQEIGNGLDEWFRRIHPDDLDQVTVDITAHLVGGATRLETEYRIKDRKGAYRWMRARGLAARDEGGKAVRLAGLQADVTALRKSRDEALASAFRDPLTGLPNRALVTDRLDRTVARVRASERSSFAVLLLDVDRFKVVNDSLGHGAGDELLKIVARRLQDGLRPQDTVARMGGDEFLILLEELSDPKEATETARRVQRRLLFPFQLRGQEVFASASVGVVVGDGGYGRPEDVLRDAEIAMYRAKAAGGGRSVVFEADMRQRAVARMRLETDLRRAIEAGELELRFQPIVALGDAAITGFEALVRWHHPERGLLLPDEFIPVAEETGMVIPLDRHVLRKACRQLKRWQRRHGDELPVTVSVNLSSKQFTQPDLVQQIALALEETGLDPRLLKVEITEGAMLESTEATVAAVSDLQELGVRVLLDDFGTGYSSLSYLHRLPIDALKIDRSFIAGLAASGKDLEIVRTLLVLTRELGIDAIAEGVATREQLELLRAIGCRYGQGHFFAEPLTAAAASELLEERLAGPPLVAPERSAGERRGAVTGSYDWLWAPDPPLEGLEIAAADADGAGGEPAQGREPAAHRKADSRWQMG